MRLFIVFICFIFLAAAGAMFYVNEQERQRVDQEIKELRTKKDQVLKLDSLRNAIEAAVSDSLKIKFAEQNKRIKAIETDLLKTRKENEELQKLYNSIDLNMPEL